MARVPLIEEKEHPELFELIAKIKGGWLNWCQALVIGFFGPLNQLHSGSGTGKCTGVFSAWMIPHIG